MLPHAVDKVMVSRQTALRSQMKIVNIAKRVRSPKKYFALLKFLMQLSSSECGLDPKGLLCKVSGKKKKTTKKTSFLVEII